MKTIRIKVSGKVQGVFYRKSAFEKAIELHIGGTVRNCDDDTVEILATGTSAQLDELVSWCWKGPAKASVTDVFTQPLTLHEFRSFSIIRQ